ncbi:MAG: protein phosphatase 2C domain-containing protein [Pirellulales bacterium]|nr:protein phosphatase 2C domain-containing protein [Pirellulales bacterium]
MPFQSRIFRIAKDVGHPEENQDAYALDPARGIAVVADGVASAIFSKQWAAILVEATLADTPDPAEAEAFGRWLARQRQTWTEQIDVTGLAWYQKAKLPLGAFSTLLWVQVQLMEEPQEGAFGAYRLWGGAIGDSCLFHVRRGELVRMFPIQAAEEFEADPVVIGSVDLNRDQLLQFAVLDELCYEDDLLVLCTDAVADWAMRQIEADQPPDWNSYWGLTQQQWRDEIMGLRHERAMRYDDATLVLLRVAAQPGTVETPEESPIPAEVESPDGTRQTQAIHEEPAASQEEPVVAEAVEPADGPQAPSQQEQRAATDEDWAGKFKSAGEQLSEGIELASEQVLRGLSKWKKKAVEKYREKFKRDDR